ncbi:MAG: indole-3-glycerol phosphate synthase TrpC [Phycisphaerales bacterium]|jgi:indole-3-glycerol phosphate synthase
MGSNFLKEMAEASAARARAAMTLQSLASLRSRSFDTPPPKAVSLGDFGLIAEVKRSSPSEGVLAADSLDALSQARTYADAGASMISVLTEPSRFGGSEDDLRQIARSVDVPVMRKDFLVDPYQVVEARAWGASAVLLIARILDDEDLRRMLNESEEMGLVVLVEAFDGEDLERANAAIEGRANVLLGLNCRDLATLEEDVGRFREVVDRFPAGVPKIAESGIATGRDAAAVATLGYDGALVGTALMRSDNPGALARAMIEAGRAARG